jgi:hypothetical protein
LDNIKNLGIVEGVILALLLACYNSREFLVYNRKSKGEGGLQRRLDVGSRSSVRERGAGHRAVPDEEMRRERYHDGEAEEAWVE